jgi:hypothetical protein
MENKYYLYRHIRLDKNEPFYIGIGTNYININYKRAKAKDRRSKAWNNIINKTNYEVEIMLESNDLNFIRNKEIEFIKLYGRKDLGKGTLANLVDGGEGNFGYIPSKEIKELQSKRMLGSKASETTKKKMSIAQKNKKVSEETGKKISKTKKGCKGHNKYTFNKRLLYIPENKLFKSIAAAAVFKDKRRGTFTKELENGLQLDFKFISEEEYCKTLNVRNTQKERLIKLKKKTNGE